MPANIRVSAQFPFPAGVAGTAPIQITKLNGIWTVSFNVAGLGVQVPPGNRFASDLIPFWDSIAKTWFTMSILTLTAAITPPVGARTQRSVLASPIGIGGADAILNININAGAPTCALPAAATRAGAPLTFVDVGLHAAAHNITITPNGGETIVNGPSPYVMNANGQSVTFVPFNDGTNIGWSIQ